VPALLDRAAQRMETLCRNLLVRSYPRSRQPPLTDEMLGAVVERLLEAMRGVRPQNVRQCIALVNQHRRWELNDLAQRLDE
jgi:RNA polymerase sigma-70 factor (ECF subfamily)